MTTGRKTFYPPYMILYALIGLAIAVYDCYMIYTGQLLWCPPPIDGCNTVAYSPYGRIYGVPIGYFGVLFYSVMMILAALLVSYRSSRRLRVIALVWTALGVCGSIAFMWLDITFIRAFCVYCMISAILTVLLLLSAIAHLKALPLGHEGVANQWTGSIRGQSVKGEIKT